MNKPEIRLQGFEGEWEKECFQNLFEPLKNNSLSRAELSDEGDVANIHYGDILIRYGECLDTSTEFLTYILDGEKGKQIYRDGGLKNGDVIFADAAEDNTVGKCTELICKDEERIVSGLHTIACRPIIDVAGRYLGYYLNSPAFHNQLLSLIQGTKISSLSRKAISTTSVIYPIDKQEQQAIASYFSALDRQIASAEKKVASLKQVKVASLQSMFPQEGETVPKVRFKGFDGEWKKVKLGDVAEIAKGQNLQSKDFVKGNIPVIAGGQSYAGTHNKSNQKGNCITISASGAYAGYVWYHNYPIFASDCSVVKGSYRAETLFLYYILKWKQSNIYKSQTGGAQPHIHPKDIVPIEFFLPSLPEQQAIASYFTALDKQIALHAQRLEKLRQIKSACLNKMFV